MFAKKMIVYPFLIAVSVVLGLVLIISVESIADAAVNYPTRQVEVIVPYSPGGGVDTNCRALAPSLEKALGATVLTVNKPGAGGVVGFTYIGSARKDGYTLGLAALSSICTNAALGDFAMDPRESYVYLGGVVFDPAAIAVSKESPFDTLDELISYAKANPNKLSYGATGDLSLDAMLCRDLMRAGDVKINIVNFNGGSEAMAALMGGHIQIMGGTYSEVNSFYQDGEVKILGLGGVVDESPELKTFKDQGFSMSITGARRAVLAPKGLPESVIVVLEKAVKEAVESEDYKKRATNVGLTPKYASPEDLREEVHQLMDFFLNNDFDI